MGEAVLLVYFPHFLPHKQYICSQVGMKRKDCPEEYPNVTICTDLESIPAEGCIQFWYRRAGEVMWLAPAFFTSNFLCHWRAAKRKILDPQTGYRKWASARSLTAWR